MKKVIFDLDGTLYETGSGILEAVRQTLAYFSLPPVPEEIIKSGIGKKLDEFLQMILPEQVDLETARTVFRDREHRAVKEQGRLFPGIRELLQELIGRGFSLYVCSNGSEEYINLVLDSMGIRNYFSGITSSKFLPSKGKALLDMVSEGEFALVVGDTAIDYKGAVEAGLPSIAAVYGYGRSEDHCIAVLQAKSPSEVLSKILLAELFHEITQKLILDKKCRIIGINGVDTSGKTRFTELYSNYLDAIKVNNQILHMDDFHHPAAIRYRGKNEVEAYYQNAFNYEQVMEEILLPFHKDGVLDREVVCLELDTDRYEAHRKFRLDETAVLLIEGVLLFREPILPYLEGKIYLHIPFEEVIRRASLRDVPRYGEDFLQKYHNKYIPVQRHYLKEHNPMEISDIVIDNTDYDNPRLL